MPRSQLKCLESGSSLIEVLVAVVIMVVGLLGIVGMQARLQKSDMEAYQRTQAVLLMNDMAGRIAINRTNALSYVTTAALGSGMACPTLTSTVVQTDAKEWCAALQGAAETKASVNVGAMIGGRGCVEKVGSDYVVTVAWQGLTPIAAPPASVTCGVNSYDTAGTPCINDLCRRAITTLVRIGTL